MRRGILIVICDFLVSSMLAMMTGMVPVHTGGTGVGLDKKTTQVLLAELDNRRTELETLRARLRETIAAAGTPTQAQEAELGRLTSEIAQLMMRQQKLHTAQQATPANTGKLSPEELQQRLDAERQKLLEMQIRMRDHDSDLTAAQQRLADTRQNFENAQQNLKNAQLNLENTQQSLAAERSALAAERSAHAAERSALQQTVTQTQEELKGKTAEQARTAATLVQTKAELTAVRETGKRQEQEIRQGQLELQKINASLEKSKGEGSALQRQLASAEGKLQTRNQDLARLQDELARTRHSLEVARLERNEAQRQKKDLEQTIKSAVSGLSSARREVEKLQITKGKLESKLETTEKFLQKKSGERVGVISAYSGAIVQYNCELTVARAFHNEREKTQFFLPVVLFDGKPMLLGTFNKFAGDSHHAIPPQKILKVSHSVFPLSAGAAPQQLKGPLLIAEPEHLAAAIPCTITSCKPLPLLKADALFKRGLTGLYLFKCTSLGKESALLDGRCSPDLSPTSPALFIRNAGRANNELRAEPGDFILTGEGEFVALVVSADSSNDGRVQGVKAMLFGDEKLWSKARVIPANGNRHGEELSKIRREYPSDASRRW